MTDHPPLKPLEDWVSTIATAMALAAEQHQYETMYRCCNAIREEALQHARGAPVEISEEMVERGRLAAVAFAKEEQGDGFSYIADAPHERAAVRRVIAAALGNA